MTPNVPKLSGDGGTADGVRCSAMLGGAIIFIEKSKLSPTPGAHDGEHARDLTVAGGVTVPPG
jgi:hypothetical protein